jgi:hypothetical protein
MSDTGKLPRHVPWVNASAGFASFALAAWFHSLSDQAAQDAVARYGRNVDSGALEEAVARFYFLPAGCLFAVAALVMLTQWRWRRVPSYAAWAFLVLPLLLLLPRPAA